MPNSSTITIADYVQWLTAFRYSFKQNEITGQIECNGEPLTDSLFGKMQYQLIEKGCTSERYARVAIQKIAYENRYDPIKNYLTSLPYDGGQYFDQVTNCITNPDGLFPLYLRKWMIGTVSKTLQGTQNRMLVLDGPQNVGKSLFVRWLCSGIPDYFVEGAINADSNDTLIRLTQKWIWEVGELGSSLRKADREALKDIITKQKATFRRPYGRYEETVPVKANLIGTINNEGGFLDDPTGHRRFMVCETTKFDWEAYTQIDVNKLWGEIYAAYLIGEETDFSDKEKKQIELNNKNYEVEDSIELVLRDKYYIDADNMTYWTPTIQIMATLNEYNIRLYSPKAVQMAIASTCKKLGLARGQKNNQRGYFGIQEKLP